MAKTKSSTQQATQTKGTDPVASFLERLMAIRSRALNSALLAALVGDIDGSELDGLVRFGSAV
jgi:hypothetical protein